MKTAATLFHRQTVGDVMTSPVITVPPQAHYKEVVRLMAEHAVSALPVVDDTGSLLGVVSEADLLLKREWRHARHMPWLQGRGRRLARTKASAMTAGDLMSSPAITVDATVPLSVAARLLRERAIKRLPVMDGGRLVGIVSRGDILKTYLRDDQEIRRDVIEGVMRGIMWMDPASVEVEVQDGVVSLRGVVELSSEAEILVNLVRGLDGVVGVKSSLTYRVDDRSLSAVAEAHVR